MDEGKLRSSVNFSADLGSCPCRWPVAHTVALATVSYVQTKWAYEDQERREQEKAHQTSIFCYCVC